MKKKRIVSFIACGLGMILTVMPVSATSDSSLQTNQTTQSEEPIIAEGTCGESLTWSLSKEGKLTIDGEGDMDDYAYSENGDELPPWYEYRDSIKEIQIGEEVTGIGSHAFFGVNHVPVLYIPEKVSRVGMRFADMAGISEITVDEGNEYFKAIDGVLYTKDEACIVQYPKEKEGTSYTVPEGVKEIGAFAFSGCSLVQVALPDTLEAIGYHAFTWSHSLSSIEIPSGVKSIGEWAFGYCEALEAVTYQGEKPEIAETAFAECPLLPAEEEEPIIAEGTCGESLTWSLSESGKLTIDGEGDMDDYAYSENGDELAPWYEYRDSITEIEIGKEVTGIGTYAFWSINHVSTLNIPEKISRLGNRFKCMMGLVRITVDEKNEYFKAIDGVLYTADGTCVVSYPVAKEGASYTVPEGVTKIGAYAFDLCSLTRIELPNTLATIEERAFLYCCSLSSIEIPSGVKSIGEMAFYGCEALQTITYQGEKPEIGDNAFTKCPLLSAEEN